jgi:hypothetical protein
MQNEYASLPDFALDAHAPAVRRDDLFDQTQPQSVSANLSRLRLFAAIERLEDALLLGRRDAKSASGIAARRATAATPASRAPATTSIMVFASVCASLFLSSACPWLVLWLSNVAHHNTMNMG